MAQFKAQPGIEYLNPKSGQKVSYTQEQLADPATGFLSSDFQTRAPQQEQPLTSLATSNVQDNITQANAQVSSIPLPQFPTTGIQPQQPLQYAQLKTIAKPFVPGQLLEKGQVFTPIGSDTPVRVENITTTPDNFRIVDISIINAPEKAGQAFGFISKGKILQTPSGAFISQNIPGGLQGSDITRFSADIQSDLEYARQFGKVTEAINSDGSKTYFVDATGEQFVTKAQAEVRASEVTQFNLPGIKSVEKKNEIVSPQTIPFKGGLTDTQKSSIQNLIQARPISEWTETDVKNWKFATNSAPLPNEAQVDVSQAAIQSAVSGNPLRPFEFEALRKKLGVSEANFDQYFRRDGKDIYLKNSIENIVKEKTTGEPIYNDIKIDIPEEISSDIFSEKVSDNAIQALIDEQKIFREKILDALQPSTKELSLQEEIQGIRQQINTKLASAEQGLVDIQGQPIPMPLLTGQAAALQRQANAELNILQRQEANLLESLGLEQALDDRKIQAAQAGLSFIQDDINLQFKIQDRIQAQEDKAYSKAQVLQEQSKKDLVTMLEMMKGLSFSDLDGETQQKVLKLATTSGIPLDVLSNSMEVVKNQATIDRLKEQLGLDKLKRETEETKQGNGMSTQDLLNAAIKLVSDGSVRNLDEAISQINRVLGTGMRTDRHNNPTAMTIDVARQGGLIEGVDFLPGDAFPDNPNFITARLLGDPIDQTIKVIDTIGFYTENGVQRWSHTSMSKDAWNGLDYLGKSNIIKKMYQNEGGSGELTNKQDEKNDILIQLTKQERERVDKLSSALRSEPLYKKMIDVQNGLLSVNSGYTIDNGIGDLAMINGYQRMIDPGVSVREAEFKTVEEAQGWVQKVFNLPRKIIFGNRLSEEARSLFFKAATDLYNTKARVYNETVGQRYKDRANEEKLPFSLIGEIFKLEENVSNTMGIDVAELPNTTKDTNQYLQDLGL